MYRIDLSGCLTSIALMLITFFIVKELWWFIVGILVIAIVYYYANLIYQNVQSKNTNGDENYNPEMGEVYKVCPYCNSKVKVTAVSCPVCNRALN